MNKFLIIFSLIVCIILTACSNNDEPKLDLFHLSLGTIPDAEVTMGSQSVEVTINGYARFIDIGIIGDYDSYTLSENIPDWLSISNYTTTPNYFRIDVTSLDGGDTRIGKVGLTVFKGSQSQTGKITIIQNPFPLEDLNKPSYKQ